MYVYVISRWTLNLLLGVTAAVLPAQVAETGTGISFRDTIGAIPCYSGEVAQLLWQMKRSKSIHAL